VLAPDALAAFLRREKVTALFLTTALFNEVSRTVPTAFFGVKHVLFGGEVADTQSVRRILLEGKPERLFNVYGPTENTTFTCCYDLPCDAALEHGVPIGQPICNTQVYVLDRNLELAPVGIVGELYLGGAGLAREYLGNAEMTAQKFVPHPFAATDGERLYRTGDFVRWNRGGMLEFVGRIDDQAKIRGFRVEPGEVEAELAGVEGVRQCAVLVREDEPGEKQLVAYVVGDGAKLEPASLRRDLALRLPDYMLPAAFVTLEALPLTANGKLDRGALPAPALVRVEYCAPETPQEHTLCEIYADVLKRERVGIHDDFFEIGGHSLLATRLVSHVRARMDVELALRDVFVARTAKELAVVVQALSLKPESFISGEPSNHGSEQHEEFEEEEI